MASLISLAKVARHSTTYHAGLIQSKAYRILKQHTAYVISPYKISTLDWALLGLIYDTPKGHRMRALANELGVEPPLVTRMIFELEKKGIVSQKSDENDVRAKIVTLTKQGRDLVKKVEVILRKETKKLFVGVSPKDLLEYLYVLEKIVENEAHLA